LNDGRQSPKGAGGRRRLRARARPRRAHGHLGIACHEGPRVRKGLLPPSAPPVPVPVRAGVTLLTSGRGTGRGPPVFLPAERGHRAPEDRDGPDGDPGSPGPGTIPRRRGLADPRPEAPVVGSPRGIARAWAAGPGRERGAKNYVRPQRIWASPGGGDTGPAPRCATRSVRPPGSPEPRNPGTGLLQSRCSRASPV
jgi:hypothetical protein